MKSADYWRERFAMMEDAAHKQGDQYLRQLDDIYRDAVMSISRDIESWYQRLADNNEVSLFEARKMLTAGQLEEFKWTVEQYVKIGEQANLSAQWRKKLENASARFHISRLEAIQIQIQQQVELLYGNRVDEVDSLLQDIVSNGYNRTAFEIQKGIGFGWDIAALDQKKLDRLITKPWTTDGRTFSDRIWGNQKALTDSLHKELVQGILRGDAPQKTINNMRDTLKTDRYKAGRLVHTETTYFNVISKLQAFRDMGVKMVEIVETLDLRTCSICQPMDAKVLPLDQCEPGVTVPPFHPGCRGDICPYYEDELEGERAARDEHGEVYYVPEDMDYEQWKGTFAKGGAKDSAKSDVSNVFHSMGQYMGADGGFDIENAKREYRKFLKSVPEKNRIYLEQALDAVEYKQEKLSGAVFGYLYQTDTIYYDSTKNAFCDFPFEIVNTHELGHRIDVMMFFRSGEDAAFAQAISRAKSILNADPDKFLNFAKNDTTGFLSDIFSAICEQDYDFYPGHEKEYWTKKRKSEEIFANLFALESFRDKAALDFLGENFPEILHAYYTLWT